MQTEQLNMNESNLTEASLSLVNLAKHLNFFSVLLAILIGLASNFLTIIVFSQKRFRTNSSNVYLLVLAFVDSSFLLAHFFEDTVRTFDELYLDHDYTNLTRTTKFDKLFHMLDITNRIEFVCRLVNFLRYTLRFMSAYIVVIFTLQRLFLVYKPLSMSFKSNQSAWLTVLVIAFISFILNVWTLYFFQLQTESNKSYCDPSWQREYFFIVFVYVTLIVLIPILIIFTSNLLIIKKTHKEETKRKSLQKMDLLKPERTTRQTSKTELSLGNFRVNRKSVSIPQVVVLKKSYNSKKVAHTLLVVSFSYAFLNLPYFFTWLVYYLNGLNDTTTIHSEANSNFLFAAFKIAEIFFIYNYSIKFFIYCASGTMFRERLVSVVNRISSKIFYFFENI